MGVSPRHVLVNVSLVNLSDLQKDESKVQNWTAARNLMNVTFSKVTDGFEVGSTSCVSCLEVHKALVHTHAHLYLAASMKHQSLHSPIPPLHHSSTALTSRVVN